MPLKQALRREKVTSNFVSIKYTLTILLIAVCITLFIWIWSPATREKNTLAIFPPASPSVIPTMIPPHVFLTAIPKPISTLSLSDLPSDFTVTKPMLHNTDLFFIGSFGYGDNANQTVFQYDTIHNTITRYSNPAIGKCSDYVFTQQYLFIACDYKIYKINLPTYTVEHVFDNIGYPNLYKIGSSTMMTAVNDTVVFGTANGFGVIDAQTDKIKTFMQRSGSPSGEYIEEYNYYPDIRQLFRDGNYVWLYSDAGSFHGLIVIDAAHFWNKPLYQTYATYAMPVSSGQTTMNALIPVTDGMQFFTKKFTAYNQPNICTAMQYTYSTKHWENLSLTDPQTDIPCNNNSDKIPRNLYGGIPTDAIYTQDTDNLTQVVVTDSNNNRHLYPIDGRSYYSLSSVIHGKRYILTSAGIDVIDDTMAFPRILVKLGAVYYENPIASPHPRSVLLIDTASLTGVVISNAEPVYQDTYGHPFLGSTNIWLVDLQNQKILQKYSYANTDALQQTLDKVSDISKLTMQKQNNAFIISSQNQPIFSLDLTTHSLHLSQ